VVLITERESSVTGRLKFTQLVLSSRGLGAVLELCRRVVFGFAIVPIRLRGLVLTGAGAYLAFSIGEREADYVLYPAGIAAMALVVLCMVCVLAAALRVRLALRGTDAAIPTELETGRETRTDFLFRWLGAWPLVDARIVWTRPAAVDVTLEREAGGLREVVTLHGRGRHDRLVRRFTVEDQFGLCAVSFSVSWTVAYRVVPARASAGPELALGFRSGDAYSHPSARAEGDLVEMRAYGNGDSMRHILWKTFARSRRLLVRMPERAIAPSPATCAFLVAGPGDEPTCGVARLYLERGQFGGEFVFFADGCAEAARDVDAAIDQIVDSGNASSAIALDHAEQLDRVRLGACVLFAPAIDGPWRDRVVAFARRIGATPTVIIGVDGSPSERTRSLVARLLTAGEPPNVDARAYAQIGTLRAALESDGLRVQIVHRTQGTVA
jgi:hypothetical protein